MSMKIVIKIDLNENQMLNFSNIIIKSNNHLGKEDK